MAAPLFKGKTQGVAFVPKATKRLFYQKGPPLNFKREQLCRKGACTELVARATRQDKLAPSFRTLNFSSADAHSSLARGRCELPGMRQRAESMFEPSGASVVSID